MNHPKPAADDRVSALFPLGDESISRYVDLLATVGVERGLIGPREVPRLWSRHIANCAVVAPIFAVGATVCDVGSGAGLPGIVICLARPDLRLTLVEPLLRRSAFLGEVVETLALANVEVIRSRAEDLSGRRAFDAVTARAVAPLSRLVGWTLPLCKAGGEVVAFKGANAEDELMAARPALRRLGAGAAIIEQHGVGLVSPPTTVVRIESSGQPGNARRRGRS